MAVTSISTEDDNIFINRATRMSPPGSWLFLENIGSCNLFPLYIVHIVSEVKKNMSVSLNLKLANFKISLVLNRERIKL